MFETRHELDSLLALQIISYEQCPKHLRPNVASANVLHEAEDGQPWSELCVLRRHCRTRRVNIDREPHLFKTLPPIFFKVNPPHRDQLDFELCDEIVALVSE